MLNLIIFGALFFILVFSTFLVVPLPFIVFFFSNIPPEALLQYSDQFISTGFFNGNLQIPAVILSGLLLNPRLSFFFMLTYFGIGLSGHPIFYYGGGMEYLHQPSIGYLLSFFPVVILLSTFAWKDRNFEKYLFNTRYILLISLVALLLIHLAGLITAFVMLRGETGFLNIFQIYFSIPFLSEFLLITVVSILATNLNRLKYYFLGKYKTFLDSVFKSSAQRRKLAKSKN